MDGTVTSNGVRQRLSMPHSEAAVPWLRTASVAARQDCRVRAVGALTGDVSDGVDAGVDDDQRALGDAVLDRPGAGAEVQELLAGDIAPLTTRQ